MSLKKLIKRIFHRLPIRLRCLIETLRSAEKLTIGRGSYIHASAHILGKGSICVGLNTCVSEGSWLNVNHRQKGEFAIKIGSNCFIGKDNFFTSGRLITIGDYTLTTIGCNFIGSSHNIYNPEVPYLMTGTTSIDEITIGVNCFLGAGVTVLGDVKVGHGSVVGTDSLVLQDIPPFSLVIGNPAKVVKRYSFKQKKWVKASELSADDEAAMPTEKSYLLQLKSKCPQVNMPWIAAGKSMGNL
jgi:acetyltransferase-like isoleucine patch superfamily enzyme